MNENNNNIPKGYKQTKLGVIPVEWVVGVFENITSITMGQSPSSLSYNENADGLPLIQGNTDIVNRESSPRVWTNEPTKTCEVGDLLLSVRAPVGTVAKSKHYASIGRGICSIKSTSSDQEFIYQFLLNFEKSWRRYEQGSTFTAVSSSDIKKLPIPLPPLPEQQKIASILSTWDKAIATQEALITQKEQLKKGLMQALLSGKKRFAGFEEEWEEIRLGEVCIKTSSNLSANSISENKGEYSVYGASGFIKKVDFYNINDSYISIVKDGAGVGRVLLCEGKSSVLGTLDIIQPKESTDINFLYNLLITVDFRKYIIGSTIPHIYFKDYSLRKIQMPNVKEQKKIADTLSSADKEIENLKKQLATMKLQKQGLMQELLTGKRRVKLN